MHKTKLAMVALAALSSVSVYAAESDFSITPNAHFLVAFGESQKKVFTQDQLPHGRVMENIKQAGDKGHGSSSVAILAGARIGYDFSESFSVIVSGYFGAKPLQYEVEAEEDSLTVKNTLSYSPHMLLGGIQYKIWSSDTFSFGINASGGGAAWGFTSEIDQDIKVGTGKDEKIWPKSLGADLGFTFAVLSGINLDLRLNEMISIAGVAGYCLLGEPQVKAKYAEDVSTTTDKELKLGGVIHNFSASIGLGLEF